MRDRTRRKKLSFRERLTRRKTHRLAAHVSREDQWDYDVPNIRLSRAFVVVVVLHVVAVGGILIFEVLKPDGNRSGSLVTEAGLSDTNMSLANTTPEGVKIGDPRTEGLEPYIVRAGDTLDSIASRFGLRRETIERQNGLDAGGRIYPGRSLFIPKIDFEDPNESAEQIADAGNSNRGGLNPTIEPDESSRTDVIPGDQHVADSTGAHPNLLPHDDSIRNSDASHKTSEPPVRTLPETPDSEQGRNGRTAQVPEPSGTTPPAKPLLPVGGRDGGTYTMARGDTPYSIARKYGVDVQALLKANGIKDPTNIQIGQKLRIPGRRVVLWHRKVLTCLLSASLRWSRLAL